jgi:hypothetical protein
VIVHLLAKGWQRPAAGSRPAPAWRISYTISGDNPQTRTLPITILGTRRKDATKDWSEPERKSQKELAMQNRDAFREKRLGFLLGERKCPERSWQGPG